MGSVRFFYTLIECASVVLHSVQFDIENDIECDQRLLELTIIFSVCICYHTLSAAHEMTRVKLEPQTELHCIEKTSMTSERATP